MQRVDLVEPLDNDAMPLRIAEFPNLARYGIVQHLKGDVPWVGNSRDLPPPWIRIRITMVILVCDPAQDLPLFVIMQHGVPAELSIPLEFLHKLRYLLRGVLRHESVHTLQ